MCADCAGKNGLIRIINMFNPVFTNRPSGQMIRLPNAQPLTHSGLYRIIFAAAPADALLGSLYVSPTSPPTGVNWRRSCGEVKIGEL